MKKILDVFLNDFKLYRRFHVDSVWAKIKYNWHFLPIEEWIQVKDMNQKQEKLIVKIEIFSKDLEFVERITKIVYGKDI